MDMTDVLFFFIFGFQFTNNFLFFFFFSVDFCSFFSFFVFLLLFLQLTTITVAKEFAVLLCEFLLFIRSQGKQNSCMGYYGI